MKLTMKTTMKSLSTFWIVTGAAIIALIFLLGYWAGSFNTYRVWSSVAQGVMLVAGFGFSFLSGIVITSWVEERLKKAEPEPVSVSVALDTLIEALRDDPGYAWGWHCNIACAAQDEGVPRDAAYRIAARFMKQFANVDPTFPFDKPEAEPKPAGPTVTWTKSITHVSRYENGNCVEFWTCAGGHRVAELPAQFIRLGDERDCTEQVAREVIARWQQDAAPVTKIGGTIDVKA